MTRESASDRIQNLLAQREWVRRLARSLVASAADADDVEQQTWLAAITAAPADARSLRAWLTTVTRNAARRLHRSETRRRHRDAALETPGVAPSAAELAGEAEAHARLATAVASLDEPYREAVLLRYSEGLAVAAAARRAGVPLETMRARLRRARERLRLALGGRSGDGGAWLAALGPLLEPREIAESLRRGSAAARVGALAGGGGIMAAKSIACVVATVLIGAGVWWGTRPPARVGADTGAPAATSPVSETPGAVPGRVPRVPAEAASPAADPVPPQPSGRSAAAGARPLAERIDDTIPAIALDDADALAQYGRIAQITGLRIFISPRAKAALPGSAGSLEMWGQPARTLLDLVTRIHGVRWRIEGERIEILPLDGEPEPSSTFTEVPAAEPRPGIVVRGTVRRADGRVAEGATVVHSDPGLDAISASAPAGSDGSFEIRLQPPFGVLRATLPGNVASRPWIVPASGPGGLEARLALGGPAGDIVVRVTTGSGPGAGATVVADAGLPTAVTAVADADGVARFRDLPAGEHAFRITLKGCKAATVAGVVTAGAAAEIEERLPAAGPLAGRIESARVSAEFKDAGLRDVLGFLSSAHGVNILADPGVAEAAAARKLSFRFSGESLASALMVICADLGAEAIVDEDAGLVVLRAVRK